MASPLLLLQAPPPAGVTSTPRASSSSSYSLSLFGNYKPSNVSINGKHYHKFNISCKSTSDDDGKNIEEITSQINGKFDRRNVLLGLGGLYGTVANLGTNRSAMAAPVPGPDIENCGPATTGTPTESVIQYSCCPPKATPVDFVFPKNPKLRTRPAAQWVSEEYVAKYSEGIKKMKSLPKDDPRSFYNQAAVHCAYCNGAYKQLGYPDKELQVHFSWLFLPFHRWYLYFFERILAKYTGDDNFALPYWNWDNPSGMKMPSLYLDSHLAIYDCYRNVSHQNMLIDLDYGGSDTNLSNSTRISNNLSIMYKTMFPDCGNLGFLGAKFKGGENPPGQGGSLEDTHNKVHAWVGDPTQPYNEDMGNFYSAAKDPIFYSHHANVDRLWNVWKTLDATNNKDPSSTDWKDSTFLFYDENKDLVQVKIRDCLDSTKLGYNYEQVDIPWKDAKPKPRLLRSTLAARSASTAAANVAFPASLDKVVKVLVKRPGKSRSTEEKDEEPEILIIEGIEYSMEKFVKFDVYVNDEDENDDAMPSDTEFLGSFTRVPHRGNPGMKGTARLCLGLTTVLKDLGADDDDTLLVKLVPRAGCKDVTVASIKIVFSSSD